MKAFEKRRPFAGASSLIRISYVAIVSLAMAHTAVASNLGDVASNQVYRFSGKGQVTQGSTAGILGEQVAITFDYQVSDFPDSSGSSPIAASWSPSKRIPINAVGSQSGPLMVLPLGRVALTKFSLWQFQFDTSSGSTTLQSVGLAQGFGTALQTPVLHSFADVNSLIVSEMEQGIWRSFPYSDTFTPPVEVFNHLYLENYSWTIVPVPEPSTLALASLGVIALLASRWRR